MSVKSIISPIWSGIYNFLVPGLEEFLPPLTEKQLQLVTILEMIRIENFVPSFYRGFSPRGRPEKSRIAIARAFVAKMVYNQSTTVMLIERLHTDPSLRRICGWERKNEIPSESVFSRAFAEFARAELPHKVHEALIKTVYANETVGHVITDSTAIKGREKPLKKEKVKEIPKIKKPRRKKHEMIQKELTRLEKQASGNMSLPDMLKDLPKHCDVGAKTNSKGHKQWWVGFKFHLTVEDHGIPLAGIISSASLHDNQAAIPLIKMTGERIGKGYRYAVMDSGYYSNTIIEHSKAEGHIPIIPRQAKKAGEKEERRLEKRARKTLNWKSPEEKRYEIRTTIERTIARLKDEFGGNFVRVRGCMKVSAHLMFGLLALAADQLLNTFS